MDFSFKKTERLNKKIWIKELFEKGSSFYLYPFKVLLLPHPDNSETNQILVSVSKRNFKKAVDRNKIKRRIRESYRLKRNSYSSSNKYLIAYLYTSKEIMPFNEIQESMTKILDKIKGLDTNTK
ncbi:ribonuclease P protein component [Fulvivirga lutimaris]|uniref:ribonuclease P protein component n=1 Tax=Fulvivirga lutimaris TaxID=1819566 RepID=UPI0012BCB0C9|nr:ribonuclease P protein component [Fulvivirga lutimaris]MTI38100.1 ribonuclease P protein component [Fulvivirga lutimaris]